MRKTVPEFTSRKKERLSILVNSCIRSLDRPRVRLSRLSGVDKPGKQGRHAVSKFRRTVFMIIAIEDSKRSNIAAEIKRLKTVNLRRVCGVR
ncbi:MAG: hypothetical protein GY782_06360 [Gammaproteobacteria bacterium]|nr:hypothetical protein [Gammaproteobacteria bacterium]